MNRFESNRIANRNALEPSTSVPNILSGHFARAHMVW